ncbi:unnamed protein product [Sphagnum tenellum]
MNGFSLLGMKLKQSKSQSPLFGFLKSRRKRFWKSVLNTRDQISSSPPPDDYLDAIKAMEEDNAGMPEGQAIDPHIFLLLRDHFVNQTQWLNESGASVFLGLQLALRLGSRWGVMTNALGKRHVTGTPILDIGEGLGGSLACTIVKGEIHGSQLPMMKP